MKSDFFFSFHQKQYCLSQVNFTVNLPKSKFSRSFVKFCGIFFCQILSQFIYKFSGNPDGNMSAVSLCLMINTQNQLIVSDPDEQFVQIQKRRIERMSSLLIFLLFVSNSMSSFS